MFFTFVFVMLSKIVVSMIRKYHKHKLQTTLWHREEEPLNHHETPGRQIKQNESVYCCLVVTCWERAVPLALVCGVKLFFVNFPCGILCEVWYLILLIPDLNRLSYFVMNELNICQWEAGSRKGTYFHMKHIEAWPFVHLQSDILTVLCTLNSAQAY